MPRTEKKLYELTDEHRARLTPWRDKWIANAMSTAQMTDEDRARARGAVKGLYRAANLEPPPDERIVFVPSPFVLRFAAGFAAALWHLREHVAATVDATRDATEDATRAATADATWAATRDATEDATRAATADATWAATEDATEDATRDATEDATRAATADATRDATRDATADATRDATRDATEDATRDATRDATEDATRDATRDAWRPDLRATMQAVAAAIGGPTHAKLLLSCAVEAYRMWNGGNQWSGYSAYMSFFRHVAKLSLDYSKWEHYETLALVSGPRILHAKFAIVSDRPERLTVDAQNRPHCDDGPFCRWRDGTALYSIRGVRVPRSVVERPESITIARIDAETNDEVRRIMVDRYGSERFLRDSGATRVQSDEYGTLYERRFTSGQPAVFVHLINSTPEADGTRREFWRRVHPELRPLLGDGQLGEPQAMTARNAVASTYGLRGEQYAPMAQT